MKPDKYIIESLEHFHKILRYTRHHNGIGYWFRGQANEEWKLLPKAGRTDFYLPEDKDLGRFNAWQDEAFPYISIQTDNKWEALAYAQHHGLATRLLDWTANPLVAAYFAVSAEPESNGIIYCYSPKKVVDIDTAKLNQSNLHGCALITKALDGRMLNQKGLFTVHSPPNETIEAQIDENIPDIKNLCELHIPSSLKSEIRLQLSDYGITEHFIYPDVEGVSRHINYETSEMT
ncbi:FRG domain-containing protein [Rubritalea spongiae]|uniref:FRG domain-containing protein n=1 Tax=Rubritalea spongiae TaxID=430797 RepID=A0ABW5DXR0_9BACT